MMDEDEKKQIGRRLTTRVSTGLSFIEFNYLDHHSTSDPAWIRNIYILLSFYTELLLKAIYIAKKQFKDVDDLDNRLRKIGHDFVSAAQEIGKSEMSEFGIKDIQYVNREYLIETENEKIYFQDFNDIRYDFIDDRVRTLNNDEHEKFRQQIKIMEEINSRLKPLVW
jgi:hypothetical protein